MRIALLGYEQSGRHTLFTLLTGRTPLAHKPDEASEGVASIHDARVDDLATICRPRKIVYAENHYVLCPAVTPGTGQRPWLDAARRCDLLCLVLRAFAADEVYHPAGSVDAERDRRDIESELVFADLEVVEKRLARLEQAQRAGLSRAQEIEQGALVRCRGRLEEGGSLRALALDPGEEAVLKSLDLVTRRPVLTVYNVAEDGLRQPLGEDAVAVSCRIEQELEQLSDARDRAEWLAELGLTAPGVDRMNAAAYAALGLMSFYTIGHDEARAWTIPQGATAPQAGGKIHSDIERGFIRVEITPYADLMAAGSEKTAREQGKVQLKGRDYVMTDGDVCHFLFNV